MRTYRGLRSKVDGSINVTVTTSPGINLDVMIYPLPLEGSQRIRNHSPEGFNWGYYGSGPAQLALAILLDATDSIRLAKRCYQQFKTRFVSGWGDQWVITSDEILTWIATSGALIVDPEAADSPTIAEDAGVPRCEICDWPLSADVKDGCVPGNCCYRPVGEVERARIAARRAEVAARTPAAVEPPAIVDATEEDTVELSSDWFGKQGDLS